MLNKQNNIFNKINTNLKIDIDNSALIQILFFEK